MTQKKTASRSRQPSGSAKRGTRRAPAAAGAKSTQRPTLDEWLVNKAAPYQREIVGLVLVSVAVWTLLTLSDLPLGSLARTWRHAIQQAFGWGSWVVALSAAFGGVHLTMGRMGRPWKIGLIQVIGFEIVLAASLALTHLMSAADDKAALALAAAGKGGGYVGWALSVPLADAVGLVLAWMALAIAWLFGAGLLLRISPHDIQRWLLDLSARMRAWAEEILRSPQETTNAPGAVSQASAPAPESVPGATAGLRVRLSPQGNEARELIIAHPAKAKNRLAERSSRLPPLDLLEPGLLVERGEEDVREKAAIIENTLMDFGLPVRVVEVRRGPTVTQFGVAPQYIEKPGANGEPREQKVRVSQITALTHDLALALEATSIRIEAPVPGRPIVGIEVPNSQETLVHLRPVLESEVFHRIRSPLAIALGLDVSGVPVAADLAKMPHLLIAGTTGSGKSVCINAITTCLVCNNRPENLRLVMIDPKMVELVRFNGLPHLLGKVEVDLERVIGVLRWMTLEMDHRYRVLAESGARNLSEFNRQGRRRRQWEPIPYIVLIIDELADLMMMAPEEVEHTMVRLAQMARAVGIHLVVATQRPSVDVVTGLIKANFPARISFAVASSTDSRVILDGVGAESLLGRGDMLFQSPDTPKPVRLQGCYPSDLEIERVVSFWLDQTAAEPGSAPPAGPWDELLARQAIVDQRDALLEKAIALAQETDTISASFIQRRLRIGYPRAARLMEALEELGVVGSGQTGGRPREVLTGQNDDPLGEYVRDAKDEG